MEQAKKIGFKHSNRCSIGIASLPHNHIDLAHGAYLIAEAAYPDLGKSFHLKHLDQMAFRIKRDMAADIAPSYIIARINHVLFDPLKET